MHLKNLREAQLPINKRTSVADIDAVFFKVQLNRGVNSQYNFTSLLKMQNVYMQVDRGMMQP